MCLQTESTLEGHHVDDAIGQFDQVALPGTIGTGATDDLLIFLLQSMHITAGTEPGGPGTATPGDVDVGPALLGGGGEVSILIGIGGAQDGHAGIALAKGEGSHLPNEEFGLSGTKDGGQAGGIVHNDQVGLLMRGCFGKPCLDALVEPLEIIVVGKGSVILLVLCITR